MARDASSGLNQRRNLIQAVEANLGDEIARTQLMIRLEQADLEELRLVARLLDQMSAEGEDASLLPAARTFVSGLIERQSQEIREMQSAGGILAACARGFARVLVFFQPAVR